MGFFSETVQAESQGKRVKAALFAIFDFKTAPVYIWEGDGPLTLGATTWEGLSRSPLVKVDGLEPSYNGNAPQLTITLSGVDERVTSAASHDAASGEVQGRTLSIFMQFFVSGELGLTPLDSMAVLGCWIMQQPSYQWTGPSQRTILLVAETKFTQLARAPWSMMTDRDHQRRFPGDEAMILIPTFVYKETKWPKF